jgi:large subunit ribosomal protein L30
MSKVKITLVRSVIDCPKRQKDTAFALGLRKTHQSVEREDSPSVQGMIRVVSHLVKVESV